jgi:methionine-rich copper-binding protein CopC
MRSLLISLFLLSPALAFAHAHLASSDPKKDAKLAQLPDHVTLHFSETLEPSLCKLAVKTKSSGQMVSADTVESVDPKSLSVALHANPPNAGIYEVDWKAVSKDTHKSSGSFDFTVSAP